MVNETPQQAARRLSQSAIDKGFSPVALHAYKDAQGNAAYWRIRLKRQADGDKWIRPLYFDGSDYRLSDPPDERKRLLYALDRIVSNPNSPVWIVEGEQKADALIKRGLIATTSGGATSAGGKDWEPLRGRDCIIWRDNDESGEAYAGDVAQVLIGMGCTVSLIDVPTLGLGPKEDVVDWLAAHPETDRAAIEALPTITFAPRAIAALSAVSGHLAPTSVELICGADIRPEPIRWLWHEWIAAGKLHILAGAPGTGKTTIALALAATISNGGRWPDGSKAPIGNVLMWSSEDAPDDVLVPRAIACGADVSRVHFVGDLLNGEGRRPFDPATDMRSLEEAAARIGNVKLLIVDPVVSAVAGDSHKSTETRRALQPIVDMGARIGCAVIGISHFSKGTSGREPLERVTGSLAFGALARVVLAAAKMPDDTEGSGGRLLARAKSNIGPDTGGFRYDLNQIELQKHPGIFASQLLWGDQLDGTARDLLAQAEAASEETAGELGDVADWLQNLLIEEGGHLDRRGVMQAAKAMGHAERTVHRARQKLGVVVAQSGFGKDKRSVWKLPDSPNRASPANELNRGIHGRHGTYGAIESDSEVF